jgi:hypothetical protein
MSKDKATAAKAVKEANKSLDEDLHQISEQLRSIEGLAGQLVNIVDFYDMGFEGSNAVETMAIALRALAHRTGEIVELQQRRRGFDCRGWLVELDAA